MAALLSFAANAQQPPSTAFVHLSPQTNGDVEISIYTFGTLTRFDRTTAIHQLPHCFWIAESSDNPERTTGTCRHMLNREGDRVNDSLRLGPLVQSLRLAGAEVIEVTASVARSPGQEPERVRGWTPRWGLNWFIYSYSGKSYSGLPLPLPIHLGFRPLPARPLVPLFVMLAFAGAITIVLRRRAAARPVSPILAWLAWLNLACWTFWIWAVPPNRIVPLVTSLSLPNLSLIVLVAVGVFAAPPFFTSILSFAALRRAWEPVGTKPDRLLRFLRRYVAGEAAFVSLLSSITMALALAFVDSRALAVGIVSGIVAAGVFALVAIRGPMGEVVTLESGELRDRAFEIASAAKVKLARIGVLWNEAQEANAFAFRAHREILVTRGLLEMLTKREVDAVIAHEMSHLRGRLSPVPPRFYWSYFVVYLAFSILLGVDPALHHLEPFLVFFALPIFFVVAFISRQMELMADHRSARYSGDPAGMMAGLARMAQRERVPLDWGWLDGLVLSHPSFQRRVLSLAAPYGIPAARAQAILADPDVLSRETGDAPNHYTIGIEFPHGAPAFSESAAAAHSLELGWAFLGMLVLGSFALARAVPALLPSWGYPSQAYAYLLAAPFALFLLLLLIRGYDRHFRHKMLQAVSAHLPNARVEDLVGILPSNTSFPRAKFAWDLGTMVARGDRIVFSGERAQFSLPRSAIAGVEMVRIPATWGRGHALAFHWDGGSFIVRKPNQESRRRMSELEDQWRQWLESEPEQAQETAPEYPPPSLPPETPAAGAGRIAPLVIYFIFVLGLGYALSLLLPRSPLDRLAMFTAPVLWLVSVVPTWLAARKHARG